MCIFGCYFSDGINLISIGSSDRSWSVRASRRGSALSFWPLRARKPAAPGNLCSRQHKTSLGEVWREATHSACITKPENRAKSGFRGSERLMDSPLSRTWLMNIETPEQLSCFYKRRLMSQSSQEIKEAEEATQPLKRRWYDCNN